MQNSNKALEYITDDQGQGVTSFGEVYLNPEREFSIREEAGIETLEREIITAPLRTTRQAVVVSAEALELKENHRTSSPLTGYIIQPLSEVEVFWPTNVANDNIEVLWTNDQGEKVRGWINYIDSDGNQLVNFIEDFAVESVTLDGAYIIRQEEDSEEDVEENEQAIEITIDATSEVVATEEVVTIDPELEVEETTIIQNDVATDEADADAEVIEDNARDAVTEEGEQTQAPTRPHARPTPHKEEVDLHLQTNDIDPVDVQGPEPDDADHDHSGHEYTEEKSVVEFEGATENAVPISLRPRTRPTNLIRTQTDEEFLSVVEQLGLNRTQIPFSISTARERIQRVSPAERFSGCSFRPNIGHSRSGRDCYRDLILAREFVNYLEEHGHQCSVQAASEAFQRRPVLIQFSTNAGSVTRDSRTSLHVRGRALDLYSATLYWSTDSDDKRTVTFHKDNTVGSSQTERENHDYYWAFVNCWREKIRTLRPNSCAASNRGGALTYNYDRAHRNHIHLSLPVINYAERNASLIGCT